MIAKLKQYLQENQQRGRQIQEGRAILQALGEPAGTGSNLKIAGILMGIGLGHLRGIKVQRDIVKAAQEMDRRIQQGPRPSHYEASQN